MQQARLFFTNKNDTRVFLQVFFRQETPTNTSQATVQNGSWIAEPGATVGPLTVSWGPSPESAHQAAASSQPQWLSLIMAIEGESSGVYQTRLDSGPPGTTGWIACQLGASDANQDLQILVGSPSQGAELSLGGTDVMVPFVRLSDFSKITNVFVLMLENHSFDNIFGQSKIPGIYGTSDYPPASNNYAGSTYFVGSPAPSAMPTDPGHEFEDTLEQLCGPGVVLQGGTYPTVLNSGFIANYATSDSEDTGLPSPQDWDMIMKGFDTQTQLPVLYKLATSFTLCDNWYSAMPGPTWPNRFFVHGASSHGFDHSPAKTDLAWWYYHGGEGFTYPNGSIFDALTKAGLAWRVYNDDKNAYSSSPSSSLGLGWIPHLASIKGQSYFQFRDVSTLLAQDLQNPYPYQYTFIEPNYGNIVNSSYQGGSSHHPKDDPSGAEGLVAAVYNAIRNSPVWSTSLLIITYDEHGGFYDHMAPSVAPAPGDGPWPKGYNRSGFNFEHLGVRVPTLVISPWVTTPVDHTVYEHSTVLKTLEDLFGLSHLTQRDQAANSLTTLLTGDKPRADAPLLPEQAAPATESVEMKPEVIAELDSQPLKEHGNLNGFLGIALKIRHEMLTSEEGRASEVAAFESVKTMGDAWRYLQETRKRVEAAR